MLLFELHEILPPKLFSKHFGQTIKSLVDRVQALGLDVSHTSISHNDQVTALEIMTDGGEASASDPEVKTYINRLKTAVAGAFRGTDIQAPNISVKFGFDMAGDAEITASCIWNWSMTVEFDEEILQNAVGDEVEVNL